MGGMKRCRIVPEGRQSPRSTILSPFQGWESYGFSPTSYDVGYSLTSLRDSKDSISVASPKSDRRLLTHNLYAWTSSVGEISGYYFIRSTSGLMWKVCS